jgi:hypothetical protein
MRGLIAMPKATALITKKFDDQQMAVATFYERFAAPPMRPRPNNR